MDIDNICGDTLSTKHAWQLYIIDNTRMCNAICCTFGELKQDLLYSIQHQQKLNVLSISSNFLLRSSAWLVSSSILEISILSLPGYLATSIQLTERLEAMQFNMDNNIQQEIKKVQEIIQRT